MRVQLPIFEGPLDLLLHLIKRNEVQITDIPIASITDQYLAMLEELPELNLDAGGEYLVMAATLIYIKSRMLLPTEADEEEPEADPRTELVQQLLEYQRFREAAVALGERSLLARDVFAGGGEAQPDGAAPPAVRDASLGDLLDALRTVLRRIRPSQAHEVSREPYPMRASVADILARFAGEARVVFTSLFAPDAERAQVIVIFLALLELIRLRVVRARQAERFGPITLELAVDTVDEAARRAQDVGEDAWRRGGGENDGIGATPGQ